MMSKVILHVDLNAFFAAVEILENSELQGKPIVVAGHTRRSVVTTASYEARAFGVTSGMPKEMAQRLCKDLIVVEVDDGLAKYRKYSRKFLDIIYRFSPIVEIASIDECYVDVTETIKKYKKPLDCPLEIQNTVYKELGLECSIGVAPNKFLAKVASDLKKPRGITVIRQEEIETKLWPLKIEAIPGVGKSTSPTLHKMGIHTVGDLAKASFDDVRVVFGKNTQKMLQRAQGLDDREVINRTEVKSMTQSTTSLTDLVEDEEIRGLIHQLMISLSHRLKKTNKSGNLLSLTIKYFDFSIRNCSKKLDFYSNDPEILYEHVLELLDENVEDKPIRLLGVGLGNFVNIEDVAIQLSLFDIPKS